MKSLILNVKLLIIVIIAVLIYFPLTLFNGDYFIAPDENSIFYTVLEYANNPKLAWSYKYDSSESFGVIKPRGLLFYKEKLVPILSNGVPIIYGTFSVFFSKSLVLLLTPIIFIISIPYYFKLVELIFDRRVAILSVLEVVILAPFLHFVSRPMILDIPAISFFIIGIYYYISSLNSRKRLFLSGLFFGLTILVNHKFLFLALCFIIPQVTLFMIDCFKNGIINSIKIYGSKFMYCLLGVLPVIIVIFYYNFNLYGGVFSNGYVAQSIAYEISGSTKSPIFFLNRDKILFNVFTYFIKIFTPIFTILILLGMLVILKRLRTVFDRDRYVYLFLLFLVVLITFTYFASLANWGYSINTISASFIRYSLFVHILVVPILFYFILKYTHKLVAIGILVLINIVSTFYFINSQGGFISSKNYVASAKQTREFVVNNTDENDIIVTKQYDKIIFPYRTTADISALPVTYKNNEAKIDDKALLRLLDYIFLKNGKFYILNDMNPETYSLIEEHFKAELATLTKFNIATNLDLLKVQKSLDN